MKISFKVILMKDIIINIGLNIKEKRKNKGFTQAELASKINVDPKYISRIETGISTPSLAVIIKISQILNIEITELFEIDTKEKKDKVIALINSKLLNANIKELKTINKIVSLICEK